MLCSACIVVAFESVLCGDVWVIVVVYCSNVFSGVLAITERSKMCSFIVSSVVLFIVSSVVLFIVTVMVSFIVSSMVLLIVSAMPSFIATTMVSFIVLLLSTHSHDPC